jgi:hypothetical protein
MKNPFGINKAISPQAVKVMSSYKKMGLSPKQTSLGTKLKLKKKALENPFKKA